MRSRRNHHGEVGDSIEGSGPDGVTIMDAIDAVGVDLEDVFADLEDEGLAKFAVSWNDELVASVVKAMAEVRH